jgi:hypothetical protein
MPGYRRSYEAHFLFEGILERKLDDLELDSSRAKAAIENILESPMDFKDYAQSVHLYLEGKGVPRSKAGEVVMSPLSVSERPVLPKHDAEFEMMDYSTEDTGYENLYELMG